MDFRFSHKETIYHVRTEMRQSLIHVFFIVYGWTLQKYGLMSFQK